MTHDFGGKRFVIRGQFMVPAESPDESAEQRAHALFDKLAAAMIGQDAGIVSEVLMRLQINTYALLDRHGKEPHLVKLRDALGRFHAEVENRLIQYAVMRANPHMPDEPAEDPLPGEVQPPPVH
jgi:hypothetical protein